MDAVDVARAVIVIVSNTVPLNHAFENCRFSCEKIHKINLKRSPIRNEIVVVVVVVECVMCGGVRSGDGGLSVVKTVSVIVSMC